MSGPISPISSIPNLAAIQAPGQASQPGAFQSVLNGAIETIESAGSNAAVSVQKFLNGENEELHTAALAVQKANITFDLGLQVRNKVVDAYQQIMQMQM
ncbi:MAG TPA: flagellar hook-basal body complex protein FliE [Bryobacteraceae bacterium]|nr:flagellar hook-basal body complex protein FliE [Bryobacteraceae bacterium]